MDRQTAMVSSTVLDLPEHRDKVKDACIAAKYYPEMMEHLPARDQDAVRSSMAMTNESDVFLGVYAFRYGHVPKGSRKSITEMEFDCAQERGLPVLPFLMHKDHPVTAGMVEANQAAARKLQRLKDKACAERGRVFFKSPDELRGQVESALNRLTIRRQARALSDANQTIVFMEERAKGDAQALKEQEEALLDLKARLKRAGGQ